MFAKVFLKEFNLDQNNLYTIYFYENGKFYIRSKAVFKILTHLDGFIKMIGEVLSMVSSFVEDILYNFITKSGHKIFGKRDSCRLPTEEEKDFFIEKLEV